MKNRIGPPKPLPTKQPGGFGLDVRGPGGPTRGPQRERPGQGAPGPGPRLQPLEDAAGSQPPGGPDFFLFGARQGGLGSFFFLFFFIFFCLPFRGKGGPGGSQKVGKLGLHSWTISGGQNAMGTVDPGARSCAELPSRGSCAVRVGVCRTSPL